MEQDRLSPKVADKIFNITGDVVMKAEKIVMWHDCYHEHFRAEWREDENDLLFNFYHLEAPHPLDGFKEGRTRIDERGNEVVDVDAGKPIFLPQEFKNLLDEVSTYVFGTNKLTWEYEDVPEAFSIQMRVIGGNKGLMTQKQFTHNFLLILDANYHRHISG